MDVLHPQKPPQSPLSMLNPDAPIFVPMKSYQTVEDFSDQWWDLVHSNPFFRDYWLQDCFEDVDDDVDDVFDDDFFANEDDFFLPDFDAFSNIFIQKEEEKMKEEEKKKKKKKEESAKAELITMAALKWNGCNGRVMEASRNFEKIPKVVKSVKVSPRTIHQPR